MNAQNISLDKSTYNETGQTGLVLTPILKIENISTDTVQIFLNRIYKNLPAGWTSCFCYMECQSPTLDVLLFKIAPGETADIGVSFHTDSIEGIGYIHLSVEEVGGNFKDTLYFSGSTLTSGINTISQAKAFSYFPNPVKDQLTLASLSKDVNLVSLLTRDGKVLTKSTFRNDNKSHINFEGFPAGLYYIKIQYKSGKTELHPVVKNE